MTDNGFTFTWEIENFSILPHERGEQLNSKMFVVDLWEGVEWYLQLFSRGNITSQEGNISLFLCNTAKKVELKPSYTLTIVSTEPSSDISLLVNNHLMKGGLGFSNFTSLSNIYAKKQLYLPNDTLTLRCYLRSADGRSEQLIVHDESESHPNSMRSSNSRTGIQVYRKSVTLSVRDINKHIVRRENTSFIVETVSTKANCLKITLNFVELANNEFVKIEIRQVNLPIKKERLFVKCQMTVISSLKQYRHSKQGTHLFQLSLDDIWLFPAFIITSNLTLDKYLYMDDTLYLECEFAFTCKSAVCHLEANNMPPKEDVSELFTNIKELYLGGKFCDVDLRAGDETFPAHKVVLCAMSPVFRAMFENDMKEKDLSVVEIEDLDPDTLRRMLAFIHSGVLKEDLPFENASKLFSAADKYDIVTLKRRCSILMKSSLSVSNVCDVLVLADAHQDDFLVTAVRNFIYTHANETFNSEHWKNLMGLNPKLSGEIMHQILIKKGVCSE